MEPGVTYILILCYEWIAYYMEIWQHGFNDIISQFINERIETIVIILVNLLIH